MRAGLTPIIGPSTTAILIIRSAAVLKASRSAPVGIDLERMMTAWHTNVWVYRELEYALAKARGE